MISFYNAVACDDPTDVFDTGTLTVVDYAAPAMEGSSITVICSFGPNITVTCADGQWEPNPSQRCKGIPHNNIIMQTHR